MSGGHYDYACFNVRDFAEMMEVDGDSRREAFREHLRKVADACHAIEWEDSGDTSKEQTDKAIDKVFSEIDFAKYKEDHA